MNTRHSFWVLVWLSLSGCSVDATSETLPAAEQRGPIGKADLTGSCAGAPDYCGGKSPGNCWCDATCTAHGDCCSDFKPTCGGLCWRSSVSEFSETAQMRAWALVFQGSRLYAATYTNCTTGCNSMGGIAAFDLSDPTNPVSLPHASRSVKQWFNNSATYSGSPIDLAIDGTRGALIGLGGIGMYQPYLWTFDMSSTGSPIQLAALPMTDGAMTLSSVAVKGQHAYVGSSKGVHVTWIGNLADPRVVTRIAITSKVRDVAADSTRLYVAIEQGGVQRYDISNPDSPVLVGATSAFPATQLAVAGDMVYVAGDHAYDNSLDALRVVDWSNPVAPAVVGALSYPGAIAVALDGDAAYLSSGYKYPYTADISDPSDPTLVKWVEVAGERPGPVATNGVAVAFSDLASSPMNAGISIFSAPCLRKLVGAGGGDNPTQCAHDVCEAGVALTSTCDPCATTVCNADAFCCTTKWDSLCASRADSMCGGCN